MKRVIILQILFGICLVGCGPMTAPMVVRIEKEEQEKIDESWEKAMNPVDRLEHQVLLDVFVATQAYQLGVDKLYFRSEKGYSGGLVVMEVHFDRAKANDDRFEVNVLDNGGKLVRKERYDRKEVEKTYSDLFVNAPRPLKKGEQDTPEMADLRVKHEARIAKIREVFPEPPEQKKDAK